MSTTRTVKVPDERDTDLDGTTVREICRQWLADLGYQGLCNADACCGCGLEDLMPCGSVSPGCQCAYEGLADDDPDWPAYYLSEDDALASGGSSERGCR